MIVLKEDYEEIMISRGKAQQGVTMFTFNKSRLNVHSEFLPGTACSKLKTAAAGLFLGFWISGCNQINRQTTEDNQPKVVSTSTILADLTERVGGDEIEHIGILDPGTDPHVYEPVPQDSIAFEEADLIFYNGYNLEPGLIKIMNAAGIDAQRVAVGEAVIPLDYEYEGQTEPDPHVWGDAENAVMMVETIRDELSELSPEDSEVFTENAAQLIDELQQLDTWISEQIQTIPENQRQLVTTHDAFQYYARAYGLEIPGTLIGISTEEQPSAQTVKNLSDQIQITNVQAIFAETTINPALLKAVSQESGVPLASQELYSDSVGAPGSEGDSYVKMLVANTRTIVEALGGEYTAFNSEPTTVSP